MELKTAIDNVKQAKVLLSDANNIMSANVPQLKNIESENAKLRHELFDKHMELPLDADGVPIRLGDWVWYVGTDHEITNDDPQQVVGLVTVFAADGIYVMTRDYAGKAIRPKLLTRKGPEPHDSWEFEGEYDDAYECPECGKKFILEVHTEITYTSKRRIEDMPEGWRGDD